MSFGHRESIASILWVNCIVDYGSTLYSGTNYMWMSQNADLVTSLDSLFYRVYYYLGSLTSLDSRDTLDFKVMKRGIQAYPNDWRLALMLSMRYSQGPLHDYSRAADLMQNYANIDSIPEYVQQMGSSLRILGYPRKIAILTLLEDFYDPKLLKFKRGVARRLAMVIAQDQSVDLFKLTDELMILLEKEPQNSSDFLQLAKSLENLQIR
jgi:hypothetical protein